MEFGSYALELRDGSERGQVGANPVRIHTSEQARTRCSSKILSPVLCLISLNHPLTKISLKYHSLSLTLGPNI